LRDVLRKVLLFLGLAILLAGLVLLGFGSVRSKKLEQLSSSTNSWEVSGNLTSGHTYVMDIISSYQWRDDWTSAGGYPTSQPVDVEIISPDGNKTELKAYFYATDPVVGPNYTVPSPRPSFVEVEYSTVDHNSLEVDASYPQARFAVKNGGNYTARIIPYTDDLLAWTSGPPSQMVFEEEIIENASSLSDLLEGSGVVCLFSGAVISVWMARASKRTRTKRKPSTRAKSSIQMHYMIPVWLGI
jgi:hypothetical protein